MRSLMRTLVMFTLVPGLLGLVSIPFSPPSPAAAQAPDPGPAGTATESDVFRFESFSSMNGLITNGSVDGFDNPVSDEFGNSVVRMTANQQDASAMYWPESVDAASSWRSEVSFRSHAHARSGADGVVLVIGADPERLGLTGGGLGYGGVPQTIAIEADTYLNSWDESENHIGLSLEGDQSSVIEVPLSGDFEDGNVWTLWTEFDESSSTLSAWAATGSIRPATPLFEEVVDVVSILGGRSGYFGVTSAGGDHWSTHDIHRWVLSVDNPAGVTADAGPDQQVVEGTTVQLTGSAGSTLVSPIQGNYRELVLASGPTTYLPLDEASPVFPDIVGVNDGSLVGNVASGSEPAFQTGVASALLAGGTGDYIALGSDSSLRPAGDFAVEAWFRTDRQTSNQWIGRWRTYGWEAIVNADGRVRMSLYGASGNQKAAHSPEGVSYSDGEWHHYLGQRRGDELQLYLDGVLVATQSFTESNRYGGGAAAIGRQGNHASGAFQGNLDEFALYAHSLSPEEIQNHYCVGSGACADELTYEWELVSADGPPVSLSSTTDLAPTFFAPDDGVYTFRLTARQGEAVASDLVTIRVANQNPVVETSLTPSSSDGAVLLTTNFTDPGSADTHRVTIDWGDGTEPQQSQVPVQGTGWGAISVAHVYAAAGDYTATIQVIDDDGGVTETATTITIAVGGTVRPVPEITLWADGTTDAELRIAGRDVSATGRTNSNDALAINGDGVRLTEDDAAAPDEDQVTAVGTQTDSGRNHTLATEAAAAAVPPVVFDLVDYRPGGRGALAAGDRFVDLTASCDADSEWAPTGPIDSGLYWSPCDVDLAGLELVADGVTIASEGSIRVSGAGHRFVPLVDSVALLAGDAIRISGDSHQFDGAVIAPNGSLRVAGIDSAFTCGALGLDILVTGQGHTFDASACPTPDAEAPSPVAVSAAPVVAPTLVSALLSPISPTDPGADLTFTGSVTHTGATVAVPGLVQLVNDGASPAVVTAVTAELEVLDAVTDTWRPLTDGSSTASTVATLVDATTTTPGGPLVGTTLAPGVPVAVGASALFELEPAQLAELMDVAVVADVRISIDVTTDLGVPLRTDLRLDGDLGGLLQSESADITDLAATLASSGGASVPITAASLAPGESASASVTVTAPSADPIAVGETNTGFVARLETVDGSRIAASLNGVAMSGIGTLPVVGGFDVVDVALPIVTAELSAPPSARQGDTVDATVTISNVGSAAATLAVELSETELGSLAIAGLPATLAPGETFTGTVPVTIAADRSTNVNLALDTGWQGSGVDLALFPIVALVEVLEPASLSVSKATDLPLDVPDGEVIYQIEVRNSGDDPVTGVVLTDVPDPVFPLVPGTLTTSRGTVTSDANGFTVDIGELVGGDAAVIDYRLDYAGTDPSVTAFTNQAVVTSNELADVLSDDPNVDGVVDPTVFVFRGGGAGPGGDLVGWYGDPTSTGGYFTPDDGSVVTEPTPISVDVDQIVVPDGRTIDTWRFVARPNNDENADPIVISEGTGTPPSGLGTFDPSTVANGGWRLTLEMIDNTDSLGIVWVDVIVEGQLKLGRFSLTYEDMSVPVGGIPVQVMRSYDTLDRNQVGDFGYGWDLELGNFDVATNGPLGFAGWQQYSCGGAGIIFTELCYEALRPHFVTVTWPNGQVESFDMTPGGGSTFFAGQATVSYDARDERTTSKLSPLPGDATVFYDSNQGSIFAGGFGEGGIYDPQRFVLTDRFGAQYILDVDDGLVETIDRNGNSVRVTDEGIISSNGASVLFTRDAEGRIVSATGPDAESVSYSYDAAGDLVAAVDQNANTYAYGYGTAANGGAHYLTSIDDPGAGPQRVLTYDDDGRLVSATDAEGNVTQIDVDVDARTEIVTSPDGLMTTITSFDARGNALEVNEVYDGANHRSSFTYDELDQVTVRTDPNGNTWAGSYDDRNLLAFTDAEGNASSFTYDSFGYPTSVTDAEGNSSSFGYDGAGNLVSITDARGGVQSFTYDGRGNQLTRSDQLGRVWSWTYDGSSRVRAATDPRGNTTTYGYDSFGRIALITAADGGTTVYNYDDVGNLIRITDPLDRETGYRYDSRDRLERVTDPAGGSTFYSYDDNDRLLATTDPTARQWTYGYGFDRLVTETAPDGGVTSYGYDGAGRVDTVTDPLGRVTSYGYDAAGRRISTTSPIDAGVTATSTVTLDGNGRVTARTNAEGETTGFAFDGLGRRVSMTDALGRTTSYGFDAVGNRVSMTNGAGETTAWGYDLAGQLTSMTDAAGESSGYTYDDAGNVSSVTDALGRTTSFTHDEVNRRVATTLPSGHAGGSVFNVAGELTSSVSPAGYGMSYAYDVRGLLVSSSDALGNTESYGYDAAGRRVSSTDARGNTTVFAFDPAGRVESETDALGGQVSFGYDVAGQRTSVTDANGATRSFGFDEGGRLVTATDAEGRTTNYGYDLVGRRTSSTDARGVVISSSFDAAGQLTARTSPSEVQSFVYDGAGRRTSMTDASGATGYTFDPVGRVTEISSTAGTVTYGWNAAGERTLVGTADALVATTYDVNGFVAQVTDWRGDSLSYTNDPDGRVVGVERSNGVDTVNAFDAAGRLDRIDHTLADGSGLFFDYELDADGNRVGLSTVDGAESYTLDELSRLTAATYVDGTSEAFGYDESGNRVSHTDRDGATVTYTLDDTGALVSDSEGTVYVYDEAGNLVSSSLGEAYVWDDFGRLVEATRDGETDIATWNAAGDRVVLDGDAHTLDATGLATVTNDGVDSFVHGVSGVVRGGDDWLLTDATGSVRAVANADGELVSTADYTAFGEALGAGSVGVFGFAGEYTDPNGLVHLRARPYDPGSGRLLAVDPVQPGSPGTTGWGLYSYAGNNPSTWTDPSGSTVLLEYVGDVAEQTDNAEVLTTAVSNCASSGLLSGIAGLQGRDVGANPGRDVIRDCAHGAAKAQANSLLFFGVGKLSGKVINNLRHRPRSRLTRDQIHEYAERYAHQAESATGATPTVTTIAVDTRTGRVYPGFSNHGLPRNNVNPDLQDRLDDLGNSRENWNIDNCGEVGACSRALDEGALFEDLRFYTINTKSKKIKERCANCVRWAQLLLGKE